MNDKTETEIEKEFTALIHEIVERAKGDDEQEANIAFHFEAMIIYGLGRREAPGTRAHEYVSSFYKVAARNQQLLFLNHLIKAIEKCRTPLEVALRLRAIQSELAREYLTFDRHHSNIREAITQEFLGKEAKSGVAT